MVILLEPTQNAAMREADPYASDQTIWYHVIWGTVGAHLDGVARINANARPNTANARIARPKRVQARVGRIFYDTSMCDQPIRNRAQTTESVVIPRRVRPALACAICDVCARRRLAVRCMSIGGDHVHALMKLDADPALARATIEDCKRIACLLACSDRADGFWARGCELLPVRSELHFDRVSHWICEDDRRGSHVWKHPRLKRAEEEARTGRAEA